MASPVQTFSFAQLLALRRVDAHLFMEAFFSSSIAQIAQFQNDGAIGVTAGISFNLMNTGDLQYMSAAGALVSTLSRKTMLWSGTTTATNTYTVAQANTSIPSILSLWLAMAANGSLASAPLGVTFVQTSVNDYVFMNAAGWAQWIYPASIGVWTRN